MEHNPRVMFAASDKAEALMTAGFEVYGPDGGDLRLLSVASVTLGRYVPPVLPTLTNDQLARMRTMVGRKGLTCDEMARVIRILGRHWKSVRFV